MDSNPVVENKAALAQMSNTHLVEPLEKFLRRQHSIGFPIQDEGISSSVPKLNAPKKHHSRRKINPSPMLPSFTENIPIKDKIIALEKNCKNEYSSGDEKKQISSTDDWIIHQYFTPNCDNQFFNKKEFAELIAYIGVQPQKSSFKLHNQIQKSLPKPKLFQRNFIQQQREHLNEVRNYKRKKNYPKRNILSIDPKNAPILQTGDNVWAKHPICNHLHPGTILAPYKEDIYMIKFDKPSLGAHKIPDTEISSTFMNNNNSFLKNITKQIQPSQIRLQNLNLNLLYTYISLLEFKSELIKRLEDYHQIVMSLKEKRQNLSEGKLQEYGWVGSLISLTNILLKYLTVYHPLPTPHKKQNMRGEKNLKLPSITPNPEYANLSSGATLSDDSEEKKDSNKREMKSSSFQEISFRKKEEGIKINEVLEKISKQNDIGFEDETRKKELEDLIKSLIGILSSIKDQGKNYNSIEDNYLKQLEQLIGDKHPEYFNEIYETIRSLQHKFP